MVYGPDRGCKDMTPNYGEILKGYPNYMSLEQMRVACHISKQTARRLLQSGLIPCKSTDKKTHTYQIKKTAVIKYLKQRDITPEKFAFRKGSSTLACTKVMSKIDNSVVDRGNPASPDDYPDVLTIRQAAALSGVAQTTINEWVKKKQLKAFRKKYTCYIPKLALIEYLQSRYKF